MEVPLHVPVNEALKDEELQKAWNNYIQKLKDEKNPAFQSFELASLEIKDGNSFEVITSNNIEQKFIEQERNHLFSLLQKHLKNRSLQFTVIIRRKPRSSRPKSKPPFSQGTVSENDGTISSC